MRECCIFDSVRTPRGKGASGGALEEVTAVELCAQVLRALRERNSLDTSALDDVVLGVANPFGEAGSDMARIAVLAADFHQSVPGRQISRLCASGLDAVNSAAAQVMAGQAELTIGGGCESMSRVAVDDTGGAWACDPAVAQKTFFIPQGESADLIASLRGYSREELDDVAVESHRRAVAAWDSGFFRHSIVPVTDLNEMVLLDRDELVRLDTSRKDLSALNPVYGGLGPIFGYDAVALQRYPELDRIRHVHHPGNMARRADGAAGVLLGSREAGLAHGLAPRAVIHTFTSTAADPCIMLTGSVDAAEKALLRGKISAADLDLWEVNEVCSAVLLDFVGRLRIDRDRVNVNGGAIAMGHPMGATGAMILGIALDELERRDLSTALVAACAGAGMGSATIIERI